MIMWVGLGLRRLESGERAEPAGGLVDTDVSWIDIVVGNVLIAAFQHGAPILTDEIASTHIGLKHKLKRAADNFLALLDIQIVSTEAQADSDVRHKPPTWLNEIILAPECASTAHPRVYTD